MIEFELDSQKQVNKDFVKIGVSISSAESYIFVRNSNDYLLDYEKFYVSAFTSAARRYGQKQILKQNEHNH